MTALLVVVGSAAATAQPAAQAGAVREIDLRNGSFVVPRLASCPRQKVDFDGGSATTSQHVYRFAPGKEIGYADVTGDGVDDALIVLQCGPKHSEYSTALIAMTADPGVRPLGTIYEPATWMHMPREFTVHNGDVGVDVENLRTDQMHTEAYQWSPSSQAFVHTKN